MELGQRFMIGGEAEFEELIALYGEKLLRYATSILYSHQDAEDVVQDAFLSAYQRRASFDGTNLSAWLYKITYNYSLNILKERKRRKVLFFGDMKQEPAYTENFSDLPEIMEALKPLKPQERALLYGRVMDRHSYEELSVILGLSPANLRKQYERVKKKAAMYLEDYDKNYYIPQDVQNERRCEYK